jgi:hypothetical protein
MTSPTMPEAAETEDAAAAAGPTREQLLFETDTKLWRYFFGIRPLVAHWPDRSGRTVGVRHRALGLRVVYGRP